MKFVIATFALALSVPAFAEPASAPADAATQPAAKVYSRSPKGEGDANAITCRPPQTLPASRLLGPEVCRTNAQWAQYEKDGMVLSADGVHFQPSEKMRTLNPQACHPATMGGGGTAAMIQANISQICE